MTNHMEKIKLDSYLPQFIKLNSGERDKILMSIHVFGKNMSLLTQDKIKRLIKVTTQKLKSTC